MKARLFVFCLWVALASASMSAQFKVVETEHLRLIYFDGAQSFLAPHVARCFENSLSAHLQRWNYPSSEKVTILLHDFKDYGNASASAIPRNTLVLAVAPFSYNYETVLFNERINWVMNHELVHILSNDMPAQPDRFFRTIFFGKVAPDSENPLSMVYGYLTTPRNYSPYWYLEGMATFLETWMAGGLGRALSGYDEMVFRTLVLDGRPDLRPGRASNRQAPGSTSRSASIPTCTARVSSIIWPSNTGRKTAPMDRPPGRQQGLLRLAVPRGLRPVPGRRLGRVDRLGKGIPGHEPGPTERKPHHALPARHAAEPRIGLPAVVRRRQPDRLPRRQLPRPDRPRGGARTWTRGQIRKICYVKGPALYYVTSLAYDPAGKTLFYTTDNNDWRDLVQVDPATGDSRHLMKDCRVGDLALNAADKSLWGIRHYNGISTLVRIPAPYSEWNQVYSWPYGRDLYDIDISPDGQWLVGALKEINGNQSLIRMEVAKLLAGETSFEDLSGFENSSPANFVFSPDGKYLYGCSYYSGVSNLYRYDLAAGTSYVLSNADTGLFHPLPLADGSLWPSATPPKGSSRSSCRASRSTR